MLVSERFRRAAITALLIFSLAILILFAGSTLRWGYYHDSPIMLYTAYLVDKFGYVPYKDFFDMNMLGTYFIFVLQGKLIGYSDVAFRLFDLLWTSIFAIITFCWFRRIAVIPALFASVIFPLYYFSQGPGISLQRDYLALLPFFSGVALALTSGAAIGRRRLFASGVLIGLSVLIKPTFLIGAVPFFWVIYTRESAAKHFLAQSPLVRAVLLFPVLILGMLVPLACAGLYLAYTGALTHFIDMALNYWPLYAHMTGQYQPIEGAARFFYLIIGLEDGLWNWLVPFAICGLVSLGYHRTNQKDLVFLLLLAACFWLYPALSGQFWRYHWIPLNYVLVCISCLSLMPLSERSLTPRHFFQMGIGVLMFLLVIIKGAERAAYDIRNFSEPMRIKSGIPLVIQDYLDKRLVPGDTVQPLDWTGGAVHGMLLAGAKLGTSFLYDFHFYHHTDSPYIEKLRKRFIGEMKSFRPRFVIEILRKPRPSGANTTTDFPSLRDLLDSDYVVVEANKYFKIYERLSGQNKEDGAS